MFKLIINLSICLLLAACLGKPVNTNVNKYALESISVKRAGEPTAAGTLLVSVSTVNPAYQSSQMIYIQQPYQLSAFAENEWVAAPAQMLLPLLVESLRNAGHFHAVVAAPYPGKSDYHLGVRVIRLQQDFLQSPSQVHMELQADLVDARMNTVVASKGFATAVTAPEDSPQGGVIAANIAVEQLLEQIVVFAGQA